MSRTYELIKHFVTKKEEDKLRTRLFPSKIVIGSYQDGQGNWIAEVKEGDKFHGFDIIATKKFSNHADLVAFSKKTFEAYKFNKMPKRAQTAYLKNKESRKGKHWWQP